jgi:hypothetical protein
MFTVYFTALPVAQIMQRRMVRWLMSDELERVCKEVTVACFNVISWHAPGWAEGNHKHSHDNRCPELYSKQATSAYKSQASSLETNYLIDVTVCIFKPWANFVT